MEVFETGRNGKTTTLLPKPRPHGIILPQRSTGVPFMSQFPLRSWATSFALLMTIGSLPVDRAFAQGTRADYDRAAQLHALTSDKVTKANVQPHWFAEGKRFWYRNDLGRGTHEFVLVDAVAGKRIIAFDHARLAESLSQASGKEATSARLPIDRLTFDAERASLRFTAFGKRWECSLDNYELREASPENDVSDSDSNVRRLDALRASPKTGTETSIRFVNRTPVELHLDWIDYEGKRKRYTTLKANGTHDQHTFSGHVWQVADSKGKLFGIFEAADKPGDAIIDGVWVPKEANQRRKEQADSLGVSPDLRWAITIRDHNLQLRNRSDNSESPLTREGIPDDGYSGQVTWSPDSLFVVALRTRAGEDHQVPMIESSPRGQAQPKLHSHNYLKPGDRIPQTKPRLFDVGERREIPIADDLFQNPWSIDHVHWQPDSKRFSFLFNERGHQTLRVIAVEADSGKATAIIDERSKSFVDYAGKLFLEHLDATGDILWMSERDGWNHLYLIDSATGSVKNPITQGKWVVRGVDRVDAERREIWFRASGLDADQDPYFLHHCRVGFDGSNFTRLTAGNGTHSIEFSPNKEFLIDTYSRVDLPPVTELRRAKDGSLVRELERADWSELLATGWKSPEPFVAKGRDELTDIHGVIYRPMNFDPNSNTTYPVIEQIYAGPHGSHVPKKFQPHFGTQSLAELGFIVVQIDGMGTSNRSKAFHDVCWKNLADAGFPDRIAWMKAAAKKYPQMDLSRVGIYGGSAGGQNALGALLHHPDFYKVAVADCGCHDNRMDKIWWNELWMSWPIGPHYSEQSNVTNAHKLQGKLLLTVGELDKNVDPASTMQVVNALIDANKDFELIVFPGAGHGIGESPYGARRRQDFFVRHLLGVEPRR